SISEEAEDQLFNESPIKKSINNKISEIIPSQDQLQLDDITEEKSEINTSIISTNTKNSYSYLEEEEKEDNFEFYPEYDYYKPRQPYEKPKKGSKRVKRKPNAAFIEEQQELNTGIDIDIEYEYSYEEENNEEVLFLGIPKDGVYASDDDHRGFRVSKYPKLNRYETDPDKYQVISTMNYRSRLSESVLSNETYLFEFNHIFDSDPDKISPLTLKNGSRFIFSSSSDDESGLKQDKFNTPKKYNYNTPKISKSTTKISQKENYQQSTPKTTTNKETHSKTSPFKRKFLDNSSSDDDNYKSTPRIKRDNAKSAYNYNNKFLKGID
ncbi:hypothetical protein TVAGG3_0732240, partial [Trichomonas vaginalis G3]|uniref:hypothetical protein n=1 Tax=Trichomonas vaginalis (strain ATCC PRA-98 / G3) TaxID=412133 RepID=UPI0021E60644